MTSRRPKSRGLTARQARELLTSSGHTRDPAISEQAMADAYLLDDGRALLVFEDGKGRLYESADELRTLMDVTASRPPEHPLGRLLPQGRSFAEQVPRLLGELAEQLGGDKPDLTEAGLDRLDDLIRALGPAEFLRPERFGHLVAHVGEVIRAARGGDWDLRLAADGQTWEPWLVDARGTPHAPFALVLKELHEWGPASSLRGAVAGHLRSHLLGG